MQTIIKTPKQEDWKLEIVDNTCVYLTHKSGSYEITVELYGVCYLAIYKKGNLLKPKLKLNCNMQEFLLNYEQHHKTVKDLLLSISQ